MKKLVLMSTVIGLFASGCTSLKVWDYEGWGRDKWQQPERVIRTLEIKTGDRIADIGSGGGYFPFRWQKRLDQVELSMLWMWMRD